MMSERLKPCCGKGFLLLDRGDEGTRLSLTAGDIGYPQTTAYIDDDLQIMQEPEDDENYGHAFLSICLGCFKPTKWLITIPPGTEKLFRREDED